MCSAGSPASTTARALTSKALMLTPCQHLLSKHRAKGKAQKRDRG